MRIKNISLRGQRGKKQRIKIKMQSAKLRKAFEKISKNICS
jgi:hypothetical protein